MGSRRIGIPALLIALGAACAWPAGGSGQVLYRTSDNLLADGRMVAWDPVHTIQGIRLVPTG